jgi:glutamate-1-semialdehyde 2,1-aminomutase
MQQDFSELYSRCQKVTPGGVHSPVRSFKGLDTPPIFFEQADGHELIDQQGKRYIDLCTSFGPLILGHRDPDVQSAVLAMIDKAWSFGACETYSLELAEWIIKEIPWLDKIRFVSSGTEAVMTALRLARGATGRSLTLKFDGCYHGHVDSMLVKSGSGLAGIGESTSAGVSQAVASETLVAPLNDEQAVRDLFKKHGSDIASIIVEPLPANYGLLEQRGEFLQFLRDITLEHGSLLIFDEVISGFRTSLGGMAEVSGITPDLVTYGKIIGGGFPVGAFAGKEKYMDHMAPQGNVYQAGTLSANPVCMVAGLATLKKIKEENVIEVTNQKCRKFSELLNNYFKTHDLPFTCHQSFSLFFITGINDDGDGKLRSIQDLPKQHAHIFKDVFASIIDKGIYIAPAAFEVGFFSYTLPDSTIPYLVTSIGQAFLKAHQK